MKKLFLVILVLATVAVAGTEYIENLIVDNVVVRRTLEDAFGNWSFNNDTISFDKIIMYPVSNGWNNFWVFDTTPSDGIQVFRAGATSPNFRYLSTWSNFSIDYGYSDPTIPYAYTNSDTWWQTTFTDEYILLYKGSEANFAVSVTGTRVDVVNDLTAGTIEADNGTDEAAWVVQAGDTIEVVGGVIINLAHP